MASQQERDRRFRALRAMMEEQGLDALILGGNAEATQRGYIRYTADWRLWGGKGFVVFPREGEPTLVLGAGSQSYWSQVTGWIPDVRAAGDMVAEVINIVHAQGLRQAALGVVGMSQVMNYGDGTRLQAGLKEARLVDATGLVDDVMAVKSEEELALAAETYRAVAQAHGTLRAVLAPGKSERAVMAQAVATLAELGCLDGIAHLTNGTRPFFRPPTDRIIEEGDIIKVSLEFAGPSGYWVELSGVYSFRPPPAREYRYYQTSRRGHRAGQGDAAARGHGRRRHAHGGSDLCRGGLERHRPRALGGAPDRAQRHPPALWADRQHGCVPGKHDF